MSQRAQRATSSTSWLTHSWPWQIKDTWNSWLDWFSALERCHRTHSFIFSCPHRCHRKLMDNGPWWEALWRRLVIATMHAISPWQPILFCPWKYLINGRFQEYFSLGHLHAITPPWRCHLLCRHISPRPKRRSNLPNSSTWNSLYKQNPEASTAHAFSRMSRLDLASFE